MQQAADAIGALSVQMDAANAAADARFAKMVAETAGSAVNAVRDSAIGMGEGWLESAGGLGTRVFDALHPTEQMSEEDQKRFELLAKQADGLSAPVGKTGFHLASNIPVCTANAVLPIGIHRLVCAMIIGSTPSAVVAEVRNTGLIRRRPAWKAASLAFKPLV